MNVRAIPLATAIVPLVGIHLCYLLAASFGHVPWCNPYVDGCTSISKASRGAPEVYVYRATMIAAGVLMVLYWRLTADWLSSLGQAIDGLTRSLCIVGAMSAICLVLNAAMLGADGDAARSLRRIWVATFVAGTFVAQWGLTLRMRKLVHERQLHSLRRVCGYKTVVCTLVAIYGLAGAALMTTEHPFRDALEWHAVRALLVFFLLSYFAWQSSAFEARFSVRAD